MPIVLQEKTSKTSTNDFVSILKAKIPARTACTIVIYNSHASYEINWKVLVSNDPEGASTSFAEDKASAELAGETAAKHVLSGPFLWVDIQIESATDGEHGTGNCWLHAVGL